MATNSSPEFPYPGGTPGAEPADPVAGKPGHFAWSRWIKQFAKNLNTNLMALEGRVLAVEGIPGVRVLHPNSTDVQVQIWDTALNRWQTVHYDSGQRFLAPADGKPSWVGGNMWMRRVNERVTLRLNDVRLTTLTGSFYIVPAEWDTNYGIVIGSVRENVATGTFLHTSLAHVDLGAYWYLPVGYTFDPSHAFGGQLDYITDAPIPTSLPGVPYSSAPATLSEGVN